MIETRTVKTMKLREPLGHRKLSVEAYVRPSLTVECTDRLRTKLTQLEEQGIVSNVSINTIPEKVSPTSKTDCEILELYHRIDGWGKNNGVVLTPSFDASATTSEIWGESRHVIRMPMMTLLVYWGSELVGVFPHSTAESHRSVTDALAALEVGDVRPILPQSISRRAAGDTCPDCDGILVNTQGVLCCYDCHWNEFRVEQPYPARPVRGSSTTLQSRS